MCVCIYSYIMYHCTIPWSYYKRLHNFYVMRKDNIYFKRWHWSAVILPVDSGRSCTGGLNGCCISKSLWSSRSGPKCRGREKTPAKQGSVFSCGETDPARTRCVACQVAASSPGAAQQSAGRKKAAELGGQGEGSLAERQPVALGGQWLRQRGGQLQGSGDSLCSGTPGARDPDARPPWV